ncbi:MAG: RHS repeat protein, partial [Lysobacter sp.]|nr:RHS repeat protein [Lysobacter sp.]
MGSVTTGIVQLRRVRTWLRLCAVASILVAPNAWADMTEQEAAQDCEAKMPAKYAESVAFYGASKLNGWRCAMPDPNLMPTTVQGQVSLDLAGNGNFAWTGTSVYSIFNLSVLDQNKQCAFACGVGQASSGSTSSKNPIDLVTGNKYKAESDLADGGLPFERYYLGDEVGRPIGMFGGRWRSGYDRRIAPLASTGTLTVIAYRGSGQGLYFNSNGATTYISDKDTPYTLEKLLSGNTHTGWRLTDAGDTVETYDVEGKLTSVTWPSGEYQTLTYGANQRLSSVIDRAGRKLTFAYDGNSRLQTLTDAGGAVTTYGYDANGQLSIVTRPGGATRKYFYNEASYVVSPPNGKYYLTGIEDENGQRHASYSYDSSNRAIVSTLAGNAERVDVTYGSGNTVTVTDALGRTTTRNWTVAQRVAKYTGASGISVSQGSDLSTVTYDTNGYVDLETDFLGHQTDYDYNARGLEAQRIEAKNDTTGKKRTLQTDWDPTYRLPSERRMLDSAGALKAKVAWTYNTREQPLTQTATDPTVTPNVTRTTTYAYCEQADVTAGTCPFVGLLKGIDGPRAITPNDVTTFTYRQSNAPGCIPGVTECEYHKGDVWKITNALGQTIEVTLRDNAGRPRQVVDANNVVTDYEYHPRGWLTARKVRGTNNAVETDDQITRIEYWPTGLVWQITAPDGVYTRYTYDAAHRLTGIADNAGNTVTYTLNNSGEATQEDVKDATNTLRRTLSRTFNTLGQLQTATDAYNRNTGFTYDANGNLEQTTDALMRVADNNYDPLNRLSRSLQDMAGIAAETQFGYDALDNLTQVTDPKGLNTTYVYNGFSEPKTLTSPDTGTTTYTYDAAGNRASETNADSKVANYSYDALNRPTTVTYPQDTALNVTYVYDVPQSDCVAGETFLVGRLAKITDHSGSTTWCYDRIGQMTRKVQRTQGKTFTLQWSYYPNGRLNTMTYPDGLVVDYLYDTHGRVVEMGVAAVGVTRRQLLRNASYHPFGPVQQWTFGNGLEVHRTLNDNGEPGVVEDGPEESLGPGLNRGYQFDEIGNVFAVRERQANPPLRSFGYDHLNRLTEASDSDNVVQNSYTFDTTGNRLTTGRRETIVTQDCTGIPPGGTCPETTSTQWTTQSHTYWPNTHRLEITAGVQRNYDAAGNLVSMVPLGSSGYEDPPPPEESLESAAYSGTYQEATSEEPAPPGVLTRTFVYTASNRMGSVSIENELLMSYRYNGIGERVYRNGSGETVHTVFDPSGRWIGD